MATQILNPPDEAQQRLASETAFTTARSQPPHEATGTITVGELLYVLWTRKWTLLAILLAVTVLAYVAALFSPKEYKASITIAAAPNTMGNDAAGGLRSLTSQFSGLASLAGLSVSGDSRKYEFLEVLKSERLTDQFITQYNLLPILYADRWDPARKLWNVRDARKIPTLWQANQLFKRKIRKITTEATTGIVTLSVTWKDPVVAAAWANELVKMANDYLRNEAITESERHIAYLNGQAAQMDFVDARQAIYALLQEEINREMLARGTEEYAFKVLDPAFPPETPSWPQPLLWALIAAFTGALVAAFAAYVELCRPKDVEAPQLSSSTYSRQPSAPVPRR